MSNRVIKTTLALDGETKFKQGLKSIDSELSVMKAQYKALSSEYNSNANSLENLSKCQKNLKSQVSVNSEKVRALKEAVNTSTIAYEKAAEEAEKAAKAHGENSDEALLAAKAMQKAEKAMDDYTKKLANAEVQLGRSEKALEDFEKANGKTKIAQTFTAAKKSVTELKEKLEPTLNVIKKVGTAAGKISFKAAEASVKTFSATVGTAMSGALKAVTAYTGAITGAGTALYNLTASAALAADDINTLSIQTGLSAEQIQKFQYASDLIDVDLDTLTGSMSKLIKNMNTAQKGTGDAAVAFQALGISITDSNGELRNNQDVFNEAIEALGKMENETQRDAYAMSIFGKSAQDLNPLIKGGAEALEALGTNAKEAGMILGDESLAKLNDFNDSIDIMKANASSSGKVIAVEFAGAFQQFTDLIGANLPGLAQSLAKVFSGDVTESKNFGKKLSNFGKEFISKIGEMLPDFINGMNTVILGLGTAFVDNLPLFFDTIVPPIISGVEELAISAIGELPTFLPEIINAGCTLFNGLLMSLNNVANELIPKIPEIIQNVGTSVIDNAPVLLDNALTLFEGILTALDSAADELMPMLPELIQKISETIIEHLPTIIETGFDLLVGLADGIVECIPTLLEVLPEVITNITTELTKPDNLNQLINTGIDLIVALAEGLPQTIEAINTSVLTVVGNIISAIFSTDWLQVGADIVTGIMNGFSGKKAELNKNVDAFSKDLTNKTKSSFKINSPSKLFRDEIGKPLAEGIDVGFTGEMDKVARDMSASIPSTFDTVVNLNSTYNRVDSALKGSSPTQSTHSSAVSGSPVYITIQNASLASDADINSTAEKLARAEQQQRAALGNL